MELINGRWNKKREQKNNIRAKHGNKKYTIVRQGTEKWDQRLLAQA
jgi:hypothetical protein